MFKHNVSPTYTQFPLISFKMFFDIVWGGKAWWTYHKQESKTKNSLP